MDEHAKSANLAATAKSLAAGSAGAAISQATFKKAKICQERGGVWVNDLCVIDIEGAAPTGAISRVAQSSSVAGAVLGLSSIGEESASSEKQDTSNGEDIQKLVLKAQGGDADAQYRLGYRYGVGDGVKKSREKMLRWYRKAAVQGHKLAKARLKEAGPEE